MSKSWKLLGSSALAALVAAALFVGAQSAFAQSVVAECPNNGTSTLGSCIDEAECQAKCDVVHGVENSEGICSSSNCCRCLF